MFHLIHDIRTLQVYFETGSVNHVIHYNIIFIKIRDSVARIPTIYSVDGTRFELSGD